MIKTKMVQQIMQENTVTVRIVFSGKVQNVGFRYMAQEFAQKLKVVGSVKNLSNGSVEVYAQGSKESIDSFGKKLIGYFAIKNIDSEVIDTKQKFDSFCILK